METRASLFRKYYSPYNDKVKPLILEGRLKMLEIIGLIVLAYICGIAFKKGTKRGDKK